MKYAAFVAVLILGIAFFLLMGFYAQVAPLACAVTGAVFICAAYFIGMLDAKYALKRVLTGAPNAGGECVPWLASQTDILADD